MITWLNPLALVGLAAIAGPVVIHLLRQPRATRVPFPSLRFVPQSRTIAARLRRLTDVPLLAVRVAIVALAALALAQPVLMTPGRVEAWNTRTARAVVVDVSPAMRRNGAVEAARRLAAAEVDGAFASTVIDAQDLEAALGSAARWLGTAPPARREVVVISDFRHGVLSRRAAGALPDDVGFRAVPAGVPLEAHAFAGMPRLGGGGADVRLTGEATLATLHGEAPDPGGVRFAGGDGGSAARAAVAAGTPAGDPAQPIVFAFAADAVPTAMAPPSTGWMLAAAARLAADDELRRAARLAAGTAAASDLPDAWLPVATGPDGRPLVHAASSDGELWVHVAAPPDSRLAAAATRAGLLARAGGAADLSQEIVRVPPGELSALARPSAPVGRDAVSRVERSDARWLWIVMVVLMGVETWMRRAPAVREREAIARAA